MRGLAAKLGAQLRFLRGNARRTGVEVALAGHIAAKSHEDRGAKGIFIRAEQGGDEDVARRAQAAIAAQAYASAEAILDEDLLRLGQAKLPGIAGMLDARERRCSRTAGMAGDHDVVGIGLGDPGGDGSDTTAGNQLDANGGARIDALEIEDELRKIFNGIYVVVRRRADERNAGLRMAQAGDELSDLMAGELATFTGLGTLSNLDFDLFGMGEIFRGDAEAGGGHLLDLAIVKSGGAGKMTGIVGRIFAALPGIRTRSMVFIAAVMVR